MQCVIICAGRGTRMRPFTLATPKPMIKVCGKPILQHVIEALPPQIDELILVVGYLKEQIMDFCKDEYLGKKVRYVTQENFAGGTGDALLQAKDLVLGKFMFMFADDIHGKEALAELAVSSDAILSAHSDTPERFGVIVQNADGTLKEIIEKPEHPPSNLINTGVFVASPDIFTYTVPVSPSGELYATDMLTAYAQDHKLSVITQESWLPIGYPEHIVEAEAILCPTQID
jgi:UDP-N-acetylglucosamine diphosphorylase / glucose-1-phosphate thymidylyltransferase / UDP-N-acetylgalactosamine diphosphorylase / glucosamine-1-phosphate N-acetyltransferase / galactosamine-1-phosphate N-acetyltransferase